MSGKFVIERAKDDHFYFNLKAVNGQVILTSEMYKTKASAQNGIESIQKNAAADDNYERKESKNNQPYFVLKAKNQQIIGQSQMYSSTAAMEAGIASVKQNGPGGTVEDLTL
ncbi:YegP family protein [Desulfuromonas carbonis]|uniref:YegP family protein n=1 Tax=Desulfuromonas sp. DDH964 TaxID=1823759 RepID=UPI00078B1EE0|nr:YegP family protein [Desulfuromonas sp. DDH964]AMV71275.1 hypothetical protein DBW_0893 [Desulfuromonas sp. DDH964]